MVKFFRDNSTFAHFNNERCQCQDEACAEKQQWKCQVVQADGFGALIRRVGMPIPVIGLGDVIYDASTLKTMQNIIEYLF